MNKFKICCLTYNESYELTNKAISSIKDNKIDIVNVQCRHNTIFDCVDSNYNAGTEVFVAGGSNLAIFKDLYDLPIIPIEPSYLDYFKSILKASKINKKIAIVSYLAPINFDLAILEELLNIEIFNIVYEYSEDLSNKLSKSNCEVVIGTSFPVEISNKLKKQSILIFPGKDAIIKAIYLARDLAYEIRKEREKIQFLSAIVDNSPNGIMSVNSDNIIINYNPSAEKILGVNAIDARGHNSSELFPEFELDKFLFESNSKRNTIIQYKGKKINLYRVNIDNKDGSNNAIALFSESSEFTSSKLDSINNQYINLADKGFIAKHNFDDILGISVEINNVIEKAKIYSKSTANILILGESGTGKELFAQSIHNESTRKDQSFVAINCGAIPENLLESELFGYIEGAFSGSKRGGKKGLFELAENGTIFLDEIGEIPPSLQSKLLRVLQEREIMRIGDDKIIPIDVRVITATNKSTQKMLDDGFRSDLLYRIDVLDLDIPPLRSRSDDILLIFNSFLKRYMDNLKLSVDITDEALNILKHYSWPGNIRELENICQRFTLVLAENPKLSQKAIKKLLSNCIGEEKFFNDILKSYNYDTSSESGKVYSAEMISTIKNCLSYNNEYIAEKLGTSRTSLWRNVKSDK